MNKHANGAGMAGTVYLVGAGPGDPDLITVKGRDLLRRADIVLHDALANEALLAHAPAWAPRLYVGKRAGQHSLTQEEINELLHRSAQHYSTVVRLKGGDPFVFGRGGEEMLYLRARGVSVEVIPGISSALAVPAVAGVPITHRGVSASFAVITGHHARGHERTNWAALAAVDTLIVLMGLHAWPEIAAQLLAAGRASSTPAMAVRWGTLPEQALVVGTLASLAQRIAAAGLTTPATIVVGEVVDLAEAQPHALVLPELWPAWLQVA